MLRKIKNSTLTRLIWASASLALSLGYFSLLVVRLQLAPESLQSGLVIPAIIVSVVLFLSGGLALWRRYSPCKTCGLGSAVPTDDAWTCPSCKHEFGAVVQSASDGKGPWG